MEQVDLDDLRDAVASLHADGSHVGYLATSVEPMRAGFLLPRQVRVWLLLTRLDGTLDIHEDYAPWTYVTELRSGHISWSTHDRDETYYKVRWLSRDEKQDA